MNEIDLTKAARSPLGGDAVVEAARRDHPELTPILDDLEAMVSPEYDRADAKAVEAQGRVDRSRRIALIGTAVAALASVLQIVPEPWIQRTGQIAVLVAGIVAAAAVTTRNQRHFDEWTESRRVAEEMRSLYFRELALADMDADAEHRRLALAQEISEVVDGGSVEAARVTVDAKGPELVDARAKLYGDLRLTGQINWMTGKAKKLRASAGRLEGAQNALVIALPLLSGIGILFDLSGSSSTELPQAAFMTALVSGAATAVGAASSALGHDRLAAHYERTAADLQRYRRVWKAGSATHGLVAAIEQTLMREHRAWHELTEDIERAGSG
ncbi:MAG: DUF4231 domain-containing protein [Actinomycetota bacterium]